MKYLISFASGLLFSVGLAVGGMTQPGKVVGFLDVFGKWDPSLAFVMGGAVLVYLVLFRTSTKRDKPFFEKKFRIPTRSDIDWQLVAGSSLFGVGWGLAGYCPGPGLAAAGSGATTGLIFVAAMTGGMFLYQAFDKFVLSRTGDQKDSTKQDAGSLVGEKISV